MTAVVGTVHFPHPTGRLGDATYLAVVLGALAVAVLGVRDAAPGTRLVPTLVTLGMAGSALGDVVSIAQGWAGSAPLTGPADVPYYLSYVALGGAMLSVLIRDRRQPWRIDVDAAVDALTVVMVSVVIMWSITARGILLDDSSSLLTRIVLSGFPILDATMLALVLRVVVDRRHRGVLGLPFAVGIGCWLLSDLGYLLPSVSGAVLDSGWMLSAALMATTVWRRPTPAPEVESVRGIGLSLTQLGLAVLPLLVPPVLLLVARFRGEYVHPAQGFAATLVVVAVTVLRMARLLVVEAETRIQLARARDDALAASRAKSDFVATMSHEIRTPMNGVIGLTELLLTTPLEERQLQYAEGVRTAGHALLGVINEVLDFSRIESGHVELETIDLDLADLVENVVELVGEPAQARGLELVAHCAPGLPTGLRGDPVRIRQVLLNLAGNAVKFTSTGEVVVRAALDHTETADHADRVVVRFEVTDTGIGLPPGDLDRLFDPFSQADTSTTRRYGGTGLGLAICRRLVGAMGGAIGAERNPGGGSTFWFTVPLELAPAPADHPAPFAGLRALVVDDHETTRVALHEQLRGWGADTDVATDATAALARLREAAEAGRPHAVAVVDLRRPGAGSGLALARRVAADPDLARTGVVLVASPTEVGDAEAQPAAVAAALTRPVLASRLRSALERAAADHHGARGARTDATQDETGRGVVLVVDDGEVNQIVAVGMLRHLGYATEVATDGAEAVEAVGRRRFDTVLMDIQMPHLDGYEATRAIRAREAGGRRTPVIAMTATATDGERERCLAAGMDDYLSKPITRDALATALQEWAKPPRSPLPTP